MFQDNRQSYFDPYFDDWYDRDDPYRHVYDAYGNLRDLHAEMEYSYNCLMASFLRG